MSTSPPHPTPHSPAVPAQQPALQGCLVHASALQPHALALPTPSTPLSPPCTPRPCCPNPITVHLTVHTSHPTRHECAIHISAPHKPRPRYHHPAPSTHHLTVLIQNPTHSSRAEPTSAPYTPRARPSTPQHPTTHSCAVHPSASSTPRLPCLAQHPTPHGRPAWPSTLHPTAAQYPCPSTLHPTVRTQHPTPGWLRRGSLTSPESPLQQVPSLHFPLGRRLLQGPRSRSAGGFPAPPPRAHTRLPRTPARTARATQPLARTQLVLLLTPAHTPPEAEGGPTQQGAGWRQHTEPKKGAGGGTHCRRKPEAGLVKGCARAQALWAWEAEEVLFFLDCFLGCPAPCTPSPAKGQGSASWFLA